MLILHNCRNCGGMQQQGTGELCLTCQHKPLPVAASYEDGILTFEDGTQAEATIEQIKALPELVAALEHCCRALIEGHSPQHPVSLAAARAALTALAKAS